jgi:FAD/FMN-containing dehydrogenase
LYPADVAEVVTPTTIAEVQAAVIRAGHEGLGVCIAGGRHAMGGQQFASGAMLLDMTRMTRVLRVDAVTGEVEAEAGIQWPELMAGIATAQGPEEPVWGIRQKQTGADRLSLGGALASNIHGRGLTMKPIIDDVISFDLVDAVGRVLTCSRFENSELFRLAIGGYGLFGVIVSVRLRLARREKVERIVTIEQVDDVIARFDERIADGFTYGDFQFAIDPAGDDFMRGGVFSCYRPASDDREIPEGQRVLSLQDWQQLLVLGHIDKRRAVDMYTEHYLATSGQLYWSDTHQLSEYIDDYHVGLDQFLGAKTPCTEVITEIYVPRSRLADFFAQVREDFRLNGTDVIYGTVRLIEAEDETFLAWASEPWACTIFNLHTEHSASGIAKSAAAFRLLIDRAIALGGRYYLTYHRFATREQVLACYPKFPEFLRRKLAIDPAERFQSDWYRHYRSMFADCLTN